MVATTTAYRTQMGLMGGYQSGPRYRKKLRNSADSRHFRHFGTDSHCIKDCVLIDPPYNTGNDGFVYNDRFKYTADELVEKLNISEDRANKILDFTSKGSASHSAWLSFMYPRLYIARDLLSDNGVIFISIDDNEQAQLKLLCDDVFGEENFISDMIWFSNVGGRSDAKYIATTKEYILMYAKNIACTAPLKNKRIYDKDVIMSYSEKDEPSAVG